MQSNSNLDSTHLSFSLSIHMCSFFFLPVSYFLHIGDMTYIIYGHVKDTVQPIFENFNLCYTLEEL